MSASRTRGSVTGSRKSRAIISPPASAMFLTEVQLNDAGGDSDDDDQRLEQEFLSNPLTSYYKSDPEKGFTMDIMMMIDMAKVGSLREEFQRKERGLSVGEFVHVMLRFVKSSQNAQDDKSHLHKLTEPQLVAYLCELFAQIDINGDGSMEWEEFTSFIVDTGLESQQPNSIQMYHHSSWEDTSKHSATIDRMYYFPANDRLAVCEYGTQNLKIYDARCELQRVIKSPDGFVLCAEYIDRLNQYVVASSDLQLRFYDDTSYRLIKSCHTPTSQNCLRWYTQSNMLFSASASGIIYAWDADRMEEKHHMGGIGRDGRVLTRSHDGIVLDLLNLPTLETLASASMDKTVRLWDVNTGKHKQQLDGHMKGVRSLAYSAEYRFLVSAGFDFDAFVWNPYVDQLILRLHGHQNSLCGVEIIPDTPQIITADIGGVFKVWDIRNFACMQTFTAENANMTDIKSFVSVTSHKRLVAGGKRMTLFDYEKLRNPKLTDDFPVFQALFNPISLTFITAAGTDIKIWDANLGKLIRIYKGLSGTDLTALCLDNRSRKFLVGDHEGNIKVYDYLNGTYMKCFAYPDMDNKAHAAEVSRLYYCNEYRTVISTSWDTSVCIHDESDPDRGILLRRMTGGHTGDITSLGFSYNLSLIATGSVDCTVQIWDYEFGRLDATCIGHTTGIVSLVFLDPYPLLASCDLSGNVAIWAMRPSKYKGKCVCRFRLHNPLASKLVSNPYLVAVTTHIQHVTSASRQEGGDAAGASSPSVSALIDAYYLVGGDDKGGLSVWDVLPLLKRLETEFQLVPIEKRVECANPQRNLRVHATELVKKFKEGIEWQAYLNREPQCTFHFDGQMPLVHLTMLDCAYQWQGHDDAVYSVQVIVDNATVTLLTASYDRLVKVWTLTGTPLGSLTQGDMELARQPYSFPIDYSSRELDKLRHAKPVIKEARHMQHEEDLAAYKSQQARKKSVVAPPGRTDSIDDVDGTDYLFEATPTTLPPLQKASKGTSFWASRGRKGSNRVKPVDQKHAGRSFRSLLKKG
ncbi:hypothetical protein H310_04166 [Aphanomyces invadans]|uniref:EF-hand domain-containing protein n=1 Tax=Aphanomyces invadans TaxID=157072 RepID=A0A024UFV7_9STRA|nr:hypothetical protein H310_04166 [Aphanomyces invadans]ETW05164.1 hypothetical protein H310_04166 [Aphanomyces invadans]|eukprot:XP_008866602.1 hypothetical protein H310_04166 [Aphanomyces invadans]